MPEGGKSSAELAPAQALSGTYYQVLGSPRQPRQVVLSIGGTSAQ